jgi:hypothetical protein
MGRHCWRELRAPLHRRGAATRRRRWQRGARLRPRHEPQPRVALTTHAQICGRRGCGRRSRGRVVLGLGRIVALHYLLIHFIPESLTYLVPRSEATMRPTRRLFGAICKVPATSGERSAVPLYIFRR